MGNYELLYRIQEMKMKNGNKGNAPYTHPKP